MVLQAGSAAARPWPSARARKSAKVRRPRRPRARREARPQQPRAFAGTITGFGTGDLLELASAQATGAKGWVNGVLTIDTAFGPVRLNRAGVYSANFFGVQSRAGWAAPSSPAVTATMHMVCFDGRLECDFLAIGGFVATLPVGS